MGSVFWRLVGTYAVVLLPGLFVVLILAGWWVQPDLGRWGSISALVLSVAVLALLVAAKLATERINRTVSAIQDVVEHVAKGDYAVRVPVDQRLWFEQLAVALDSMQEHLQTRFSELQSNRDQLRAVLDSMVEGVIAVDRTQKVLLVNNSVCKQFRFVESAVIGRPFWDVVRNPQLQHWLSEALATRQPQGGEIQLHGPVSRTLLARTAGLPQETTGGAVVVVSDVSELRRLESVRQEFVANVSHELKTPLSSIKACVETLLDGALHEPEHATRFLHNISEAAERLDLLVRDMLSLTRIESEGGQQELYPLVFDDVVSTCLERHRQHAQRKNIQLTPEPSLEPVSVWGDEESLEQILDNLLDNALKYTNDGGQVKLRWRAEGDQVLCEVEDTGIGIPHNHIPRIFERFYRVDRARSRELGGTGLGLSIVKHLVQALGGSVSVASKLGHGTTFTVRLRRAEQPAITNS